MGNFIQPSQGAPVKFEIALLLFLEMEIHLCNGTGDFPNIWENLVSSSCYQIEFCKMYRKVI